MNNRWLMTGDLHLGDNPRDSYRFNFMDWLLEITKTKQYDLLLILGDMTNEKDRHSSYLVNRIVNSLYFLSQNVEEIVCLTGNHDYLIHGNPFFQFVKYIPHVKWITHPLKAGKTLFLPHTHQYKKDWKGLLDESYDNVFIHQTVEGASVGARKMEGIPLSVFEKQKNVWSGDIHVPQKVGNVRYLGAPYTVNFGDDYEGSVVSLDPDTGKFKRIPYQGPQKRLITGTYDQILRTKRMTKGDILKIRVSLTSDEYDNWHETREELRHWADEAGYDVNTIQPIVNRKKSVTYKKVDVKSDETLIQTFAKKHNLSKETITTGLKLLEK